MRGRIRRIAALAAVAAMLATASWPVPAVAGPPSLEILDVRRPAAGTLSVLAAVPAAGGPASGGAARTASAVAPDGTGLPTTVRPLVAGASRVALVVDASAGGAAADPDVRAAAASLVRRFPESARYLVVTDQAPPRSSGPQDRDSAVTTTERLVPAGPRSTAAALDLATAGLGAQAAAPVGGRPVVLLVTGAPDAGGRSVDATTAGLRRADAVLAVVHTRADPAYWRAVAAGTGGVTVTVGPAGPLGAADVVADELRRRYVFTVQVPAGVPAGSQVRLALDVGAGSGRASVVVPGSPGGSSGRAADDGAATDRTHTDVARLWPVLLAAAALLALAVAVAAARARAVRAARPGTDPDGPTPTLLPRG